MRRRVRPHSDGAPDWLLTVEARLRDEFRHPPTLRQLAEELGISAARIGRSFSERHGMPAGRFLRRLRVRHAEGLLVGSDAPLAWVAAEAGFADQSHMTRQFRSETGLTPGRYRALHGAESPLEPRPAARLQRASLQRTDPGLTGSPELS